MNQKLFPTDLKGSEWVEFQAAGFSQPVCGVIYRFARPATNGLALGAIDTKFFEVGRKIKPTFERNRLVCEI